MNHLHYRGLTAEGIPLKHGMQHLTEIGKISFTGQRPRDYWAENGYDWYEGH
ncbi:MAG: hypothetical protein ACR2JE_07380 [Acidobacteriaceae bacterium]